MDSREAGVELKVVPQKALNPTPLTPEQLEAMEQARNTGQLNVVLRIKSPDCAFYNDCLTIARDGNWEGFGCRQCSSFEAPDSEQRVSDVLAIAALMQASEHEAKTGCAGRKRGVKPGADAKIPKRKLRLVPAEALLPRQATG